MRSRWIIAGVLLVLFPLVLWWVWATATESGLRDLQARGIDKLDLYRFSLQGELEKFEFLPRILAQNKDVVALLRKGTSVPGAAPINRYLARFNEISGASDTYVMDRSGLTLAASNWNSALTFIGRRFAFRPYFQEAMSGHAGRYYALGTTSLKRGFYFSFPVRHEGRVLGVTVLKVSAERLEKVLAHDADTAIVTDAKGVIFLSTRPGWVFHTVKPLVPEVRDELRATRQYADAELTPLPVVEEAYPMSGRRLLTLREPGAGRHGGVTRTRYLVQTSQVPYANWIIHLLTDVAPVERAALVRMIFAGVLMAALALAGGYLYQRRVNLLVRLEYQRRSREALRRAHDQLEERVRLRTTDLVEANRRLQAEIHERERAEEVLHQAQDELVQAAKLAAIGQMSAGITHELNQPLAAIRSYADNARVLLDRKRRDDAYNNLEAIVELTDRMAEITKHLKAFARRSSGEPESVALDEVADHALGLIASHTRMDRFEVRREVSDGSVRVWGDAIRLEQVVLNLLKNALDAMTHSDRRELHVTVAQRGDRGVLSVRDTGAGIAEDQLGHIFDPFFTTKEVGEGLGLGLSISYGIVRDYGGTLRAANHPEGGSVFTVELPLAEEPAAAETRVVVAEKH